LYIAYRTENGWFQNINLKKKTKKKLTAYKYMTITWKMQTNHISKLPIDAATKI